MIRDFFCKFNYTILAFVVLFIATFYNLNYSDGDFFWQLTTGKYIVENFSFPYYDIFSYTKSNQPWIIQQWLYDIIIFFIFNKFGLFGIKVLFSSISLVLLFLNYRFAKIYIKHAYLPLVVSVFLWIPISIGTTYRPHMFTYLFFAMLLYIIYEYRLARNNKIIWFIPPIMLLWVNFHAGFLVGVLLLIIFLISEFFSIYLYDNKSIQNRKFRFCRLLLCIAVSLLVTLVNPYFFHIWIFPFQLMSLDVITNNISEWASPNFHNSAMKIYLYLLMLCILSLIYRKNKPNFFECILFFSFLVEGFISQRHIPLAAIAIFPISVISLSEIFSKKIYLPLKLKNFYHYITRIRSYGGDIGHKEVFLNWVILAIVMGWAIFYYPQSVIASQKSLETLEPVGAVEFIKAHHINGNLFNDPNIGGYLIYELYPNQKVFFDGRFEFYGDQFAKDYFKMISVAPGWDKLFDNYQFDYLVIYNFQPLRQMLLLRGDYKLVYQDKNFSLLLKNVANYQSLIDRFHIQNLPS